MNRSHCCHAGGPALPFPSFGFLALLLLVLPACKTVHREVAHESVAGDEAVENVAMEIPASTPFEGIPGARTLYLQSYQEGYRNGFPGFWAPPWTRVGMVYDPTEPRIRGWQDGALAARLAAARRLPKE